MTQEASTIGERLRAVRLRAGLSQDRFAKLLGCSKRALLNWEHGDAPPPISILPMLRKHFDVDPEWLVMGKDTTPRALFKQVDWKRLERLERDVRRACFDFGLELTADQQTSLVRALYDDGSEADETNRKQMRLILRGLVQERG